MIVSLNKYNIFYKINTNNNVLLYIPFKAATVIAGNINILCMSFLNSATKDSVDSGFVPAVLVSHSRSMPFE